MENTFDKIMSSKTTEELIRIIQVEHDNYQELAIESVKNELERRNISTAELENTTQNIISADIEKAKMKDNTAKRGLRLLNYIIDFLVWLIICFILTLPLSAHNQTHMLIGYVIMFLSYFLYYIILEIKFQKTLGKMITKTKVVTYDEKVPSNNDIIIRTLLRCIPFDNISFLIVKNGFHDMFSRTKVIKDI